MMREELAKKEKEIPEQIKKLREELAKKEKEFEESLKKSNQ